MTFRLIPQSASAHASSVDYLFWSLTALSTLILALVFIPIVYFAIKYRRGSEADRTPSTLATWRFEVTWTIIPFFIGMGIFTWAAEVYFKLERPPATALQVDVVGKQWMWKLQHAEGNREINELHVPLGKAVQLTMTSQDVIHDFFIPDFRVKQDVVPGRYTSEWFTPTKLGRYRIFCAQFCGTSHAAMVGWVDVLTQSDYEKWLLTTGQGETMAAEGSRLFQQAGCSGCHAVSSKIHAPQLEGLYGRSVALEDGKIVTADDRYIRDSILLPGSQIVAGYQNLMPPFAGRLTEEQVMALIAYLQSIGNSTPPQTP